MSTKAAYEDEAAVAAVKEKYGELARGERASCCGPNPSTCGPAQGAIAKEIGYSPEDLRAAGEGSNLGLGCGAPVGFLDLKEGETVLDLGSGAGLDAFVAAPKVGRSGRVIGVDMTPEMIGRARANAARMGVENVEFREGRLEALPVEDASVDAITSNCVINLVPDKRAVFREIARVLKPGGRIVVSDIILDGRLPEAVERDVYAYVGCVAGAAQRQDYFAWLADAGLGAVEVISDVDYIAKLDAVMPTELRALASRLGIQPEDVAGKVRSVTYRATKRVSCCS